MRRGLLLGLLCEFLSSYGFPPVLILSCPRRMGAELRIDRPIEPAAMEAYWAMEFFPLEARHLIQQDRAKTLGLMFCVELVWVSPLTLIDFIVAD